MDNGTINVSGPGNMMPKTVWRPCGVSDLIDGFIRDGWIAPEDKWIEVANIYRGQSEAHWRHIIDMRDRVERKAYADAWVSRWIHDTQREEGHTHDHR